MSDEPELDDNGNPIVIEENPPTPEAKLEQEQELKDKITALEEEKAELEREKKGIYGDLKSEEAKRRELEAKIQEKTRQIASEQDVLEDLADDEFITAKHLKDLRTREYERSRNAALKQAELRGNERMADDEYRMQERCEENPKKYPVPYEEAIKAFEDLARKDPSLWDEVDRAKYRPGGRPAEVAYKLALRESPKYQDISRKKVREELLEEMDKNEGRPRKFSSGGGGGTRTIENMSERDIMDMSDEDLKRALGR